MNLCFIIGRIISEIKFDFVIGNKCFEKEKISVVRFKIKVSENEINIIGYNNIADICYRRLENGNIIFLKGNIKTNGNIEIENIKLIDRY